MPEDRGVTDVLVVGVGPAGRSLAHRLLANGAAVTVVDPHPHRTWTPTYGAWTDELPAWLSRSVYAATVGAPSARARTEHRVDREYTILDTARLQRALVIDNARTVRGTAHQIGRQSVTLDDGTVLYAHQVVDARGVPPRPGIAQQTAFGLIVPAAAAEAALDGRAAWFMDWALDNGTNTRGTNTNGAAQAALASFLYAMPLGGGQVLLEETCLIGDPPLAFAELERRLRIRLDNRGVQVPADARIERVRFAVRPPTGDGDSGAIRFGARGGSMHPATGYSVAASLAAADATATALATGTRPSGRPSGTLVSTLRSIGSRALLGMPHPQLLAFFDTFFSLDIADQRAYLSGDDDLSGVSKAMMHMFSVMDTSERLALMKAIVTGPQQHGTD